MWDFPDIRNLLRALAERYRLVQFDIYGAGMSSRGLPDDVTMDDFQPGIEAVVDHLKLDRFVLYGAVYQSYVAVQYAVRHPERVKALVLTNVATTFDSYRVPALYDHLMEQDWDFFVHTMFSALREPTNTPSEEVRRIEDIFKQAYQQADLVKLARQSTRSPLEPLLQQLRTPTLVLRARDYSLLPAEEAMRTARLARGKFVTVDGASFGDVTQTMTAIENFLAELPSPGEPMTKATGDLSEREIEVLKLLAQGRSNPEIARELVISRNTVQNHVSSILIKFNLQNRAQAAVFAKEDGLV